MSDWHELVEGICSDCEFAPPATAEALTELEQALMIVVPSELLNLWRETNGIRDRYGRGIWSAEQAIRENLELRSYPEMNDEQMSFDSLFCFADVSNGDLFFFPIQASGVVSPFVFQWDHETDNRTWATINLPQFVEQYFSGKVFD